MVSRQRKRKKRQTKTANLSQVLLPGDDLTLDVKSLVNEVSLHGQLLLLTDLVK